VIFRWDSVRAKQSPSTERSRQQFVTTGLEGEGFADEVGGDEEVEGDDPTSTLLNHIGTCSLRYPKASLANKNT
jgi:hypothetical protein